MDQLIPPKINPVTPRRKRRVVLLIFFGIWLVLALYGLVQLFGIGGHVFSFFSDAQLNLIGEDDTFQLTVLEVKSGPNHFSERIHIQCKKSMEAALWVTDLKRAGFSLETNASGEVFYHNANPRVVGGTAKVQANGEFSTCDWSFSVSTNLNLTIWHDEGVAGGGESFTSDTSFSPASTIAEIQTNWPGDYHRGSEIPLADLGPYKILVSVK